MEKLDTRTDYGEKKLRQIIKESIGWMGDMFNDLQEVEDEYVEIWQEGRGGIAFIGDINLTMNRWVASHMSLYFKLQVENFKNEIKEIITKHDKEINNHHPRPAD